MWSQPLNTNFVTDRSNPNAVILGLRYAFFMPTSLLSIVSMSAEAHRYYCKLAILEPAERSAHQKIPGLSILFSVIYKDRCNPITAARAAFSPNGTGCSLIGNDFP